MKEEKMASLVETMQETEERLEQLTAQADQSAASTSSLAHDDAAAADKVPVRHACLADGRTVLQLKTILINLFQFPTIDFFWSSFQGSQGP